MNLENEKLEAELEKYPGQWFVINSNTGHEDKVRQDLLEKVKNQNLGNIIFDVRISKYLTETKSGKETEKNKFPGYIFINMNMTEEAWFIVRNTPGVTGFIGSSGRGAKPFPLTSEEVARMILNDQTQSDPVEPLEPSKEVKPVSGNKVITSGPNATQEKVVYTADFKIGDQVVIQTGPFMNKDGKVIDMDFDKGVAIISIEMFGRYTPTEVEFKNAKILTED
ncbi:Transcription termination/antitermination protein NusG [Mesoplasma sp. JKS002658]|uniref:transcription termination/antitermination protein NusG n=1 Tax=Mesoplasma whartonense TaxID=2878854 RepID=UPI002022A8F3|nr:MULTISPECIES: transcription termination/antitermination protein NusG [unclassified Mesoplasma]MCL8211741.1 Transcription termination/antitermination protein NusG [Mesoplasma sp. JKS002664]MCL8212118.1 Transcription termination/antitermination protein NusG [Mesoplasma sp. JKS002662]MCL8213645.1 Transcription termination/antitermination protein NusG [Mesoplasma sp. JKS002660]MCL8213777.1 Transcription termination/antitermination protein NusG [Mesoplasma sp. JKS002658]MCL8215077.1 Transcriptio